MSVFRLEGKNLRILNLIDEKIRPHRIAELLGISRFNLASHIRQLKKHGYIQSYKWGIYLVTPEGIRAIYKGGGGTPQVNKSSKRLHALGLKYTLKDELSPAFKPRELAYKLEVPATMIDEFNQAIIYIGVTARLTSKSLILYAPELYYDRGQPSIVAEAQAKTILDKEALLLEQKLAKFTSFKLMRISLRASEQVLLSDIVSEEIADEGHPMAEASKSKQSKIVLARHPFDDKERLIMDGSKMRTKGLKELEAVRVESAGEDSDTIDSQFNGVLDGRIDLWDIPKLKGEYASAVVLLGEYKKQIELHLKIMKKIDKKLSQKSIKEWI